MVSNPRHKLFIISGPSAVGKNSVIDGVKKILPALEETTSCTTRKKRPAETNGVHYYFISEREFNDKVANNEFLEHFSVHGKHYGTLKTEVDRIVATGKVPLAVIDVQGALYIKKHTPHAVLIFIKPDSWKVLKRRLQKRDTNQQNLQLRLQNARHELAQAPHYDYQVTNHDGQLDRAIQEVVKIIRDEAGIDKNAAPV